MSAPHVYIGVGAGGHGQVLVDGQDISNAVQSLSLAAHVGQSPVLQLVLNVATIESATGGARVHVVMPDATRAALIALGWTPPAGES